MRSLATYVLTALLIGLALDFIAPGQSVSNASNRWPSVEHAQPTQIVDRSTKGDRLNVSGQMSGKSSIEKSARDVTPSPTPVRKMIEGCDPAFSPLSSGRASNFASRCVV